MRRIYLAAWLILVAFCVPIGTLAAPDGLPKAALPTRITQDPGDDLDPVIALDPHDRVFIAWEHYAADQSAAYLNLARSPSWSVTSIAPISPTQSADSHISLAIGEEVQLAWSQPATVTQTITRHSVGTQSTWEQTFPNDAVFRVDERGHVHVAWAQSDGLHYMKASQDVTVTIGVELTASVHSLVLALDREASPHLAWSSRGQEEESPGIFYASLPSEVPPIQVAAQGRDPRLAVGPFGRAYLCWLADEGLYYASSQDWSRHRLAVPGLKDPNAYAFAVGPGEVAHLAWIEDGDLWYANSVDWPCSATHLSDLVEASGLTMTIDPIGQPHIAWAAPSRARNWDIYCLAPLRAPPQLAIIYPRGGELLMDDVSARAVSNSPASDLLHVEFYLEAEAETPELGSGVWAHLGLDRDGQDGWSVPLRIEDLVRNTRYQVVALGVDVYGRIAQARGNWFAVQHEDAPWVWLPPPPAEVSRGEVSLPVLSASGDALLRRLDLFLAPLRFDMFNRALIGLGSPEWFYVGPYDPVRRGDAPGLQGQRLTYDSHHYPDGLYKVVVVATDRTGEKGYGISPTPIRIDNAMSPSVEVIAPDEGTVVTGMLRASARVSDPDGVVRRVDFYAQRHKPLFRARYRGEEHELSTPDLVWLGSDTDGSNGWSVSAQASELLDGDDWHIRAVAFDDQGLSASARSPGTLSIIGRDRSHLRVAIVESDEPLSGRQMVRLFVTEGSRPLRGAQVYLVDPEDTLTHLGSMIAAERHWFYEWNTTDYLDGIYSLLIVGRHPDDQKPFVHSERVRVQNSAPYDFETPEPDQVLKGSTVIRMQSTSESPPRAEMRFYYRDETGQLHFIGSDPHGEDGWCTVWDTTTVLDGTYDLVASVFNSAGHSTPVERQVRVENHTPSIEPRNLSTGLPWQGVRDISWRAEHPASQPLSVTVELSLDGGLHWVELAENIPASSSYRWDTRGVPDSPEALLRLTATDEVHQAQATTTSFAINNVNEAPQVILSAPLANTSHGGEVRIAWRARDPDGDTLSVHLEYRRGNGPWTTLAEELPSSGQYLWQTRELPPGDGYQLRVVARDSLEAMGSDLIGEINLVSNTPPTVRLLSLHRGANLERDTVILWRAADEDEDPLSIDLYYSDNAGQAWLPLAEGLPNTGFFVWQVAFLPPGNRYQVRVVARDRLFRASAESEGTFSIRGNGQPEVVLLSPEPGKSVSGIQPIEWWTSNPTGTPLSVDLMFRSAGEFGWKTLAEDLPNDGLYLWDTKAYADGKYELRIVIKNSRILASTTLRGPISISNDSNHPPQVELLSPQGGEWWTGIREIVWHAWDRDAEVITATLRYSPDGGQRWTRLATLDARASRYIWDTRQAQPGGRCLVRITVTDGVATAMDTSEGVFRLANRYSHAPYAVFTSPDASGRLVRGNIVSWIAEDVDGDSLSISLSLSEDGGATWNSLAEGLFHTGEYPLDASLLEVGRVYRLRLRVSDGIYEVETLSLPFELAGAGRNPPELEFEVPGGRARWSGEREVRWQASDPVGRILRLGLELSRDGGVNWVSLAQALRNTGQYTWDTTTVANGAYLLRLTADNGQSKTTRTGEPIMVDNPGRNAPVISIVSPRGGDVWAGTCEIQWRASDADGDSLSVNLAYSLDMGNTWRPLASRITDANSYIWDTTNAPNSGSVWLRATVNDGQFETEDLSDGAFSILNPDAPIVKLLAPRGGEVWTGKQPIAWVTAHEGGRPTRIQLQASSDEGRSWRTLASDLDSEGSFLWDTSTLPEESQVWIRAHATNGLRSGFDVLDEPITVRGNAIPLDLPFYLP